MRLNESTVVTAKHREGGLKDDRDSQIDEILDSDCLGYENGDPLVGDNYDSYPHFSDLSQPQWLDFLRSLFSHPLIKGYDDARKELTNATGGGMPNKFESALERSAELFNIDSQALFEQGSTVSTESKLTQILEYEPAEELKNCTNPLLVAELYLKGLSVEEIAELLDGETAQVRDKLKTVNLLAGETSSEQTTSFEKNNGRLNNYDRSTSGGLLINASNL